jgi:hypothetical protein
MSHDRDVNELTAHLLALELQLMDPVFRKDRDQVSALLADGFREFGSSGRVWSRKATVDLLATEQPQAAPSVEEFSIHPIAPATVLVTYRTRRLAGSSLRSSIWVHTPAGWQILFHQGTKASES